MSGDEKLIFVYGTLKRGGSNHSFLAGQKFLGDARTVAGYRLYDLGGYPGMVADASERKGVVGEVWSVGADALIRLDNLEGLPEGLYRRGAVSLLAPFADHMVETYLYARDVVGRQELGSVWRVTFD